MICKIFFSLTSMDYRAAKKKNNYPAYILLSQKCSEQRCTLPLRQPNGDLTDLSVREDNTEYDTIRFIAPRHPK